MAPVYKSNEVPGWIEPGKLVCIRSSGGWGGFYGITKARVERLTPTQIVLDNGDKFRRADLRKIGHTNVYTMTPELIDPESDAAKDLIEQKRKYQLRSDVVQAGSLLTGGSGKNSKGAAENLLEKLTRALEEGAYDE